MKRCTFEDRGESQIANIEAGKGPSGKDDIF
jgi:hypothetical protein